MQRRMLFDITAICYPTFVAIELPLFESFRTKPVSASNIAHTAFNS
jgi:hypothetical protein